MGDSLSRSSESCFEEVRVGGQCACDLGKKDMNPAHVLVEDCFTQEEQTSSYTMVNAFSAS